MSTTQRDKDSQQQEAQQQANPTPSQTSTEPPTSGPPTLESLPPELRLQILTHLVTPRSPLPSPLILPSLRALVLASPVFYAQYRAYRWSLLRDAVVATLGAAAIPDACAVRATATLYETGTHPREPAVLRDVLAQYAAERRMAAEVVRRGMTPTVLLAPAMEDELVVMAGFYFSVVSPLVGEVARLAWRRLEPGREGCEVGGLSGTETERITRALYRFQLYCNLWGAGERSGPPRAVAGVAVEERLEWFFCLLRPWEVEEVDCVYTVLDAKYEEWFEAVKEGVFKGKRKLDFGNENKREDYREGTISRGLRVFYRMLRTRSHEGLVRRVQKYATEDPWFDFESCLDWTFQEQRRRLQPMEGDRLERDKTPLPFDGDTLDGPPLAWVTLWGGRYVNTYGDTVPESLKQWGHVFWDAERLRGSNGVKCVERERERIRCR
ncbi:hypothetical protein C8A05DRAFT_33406 [Staphylotrichum tortipilum]|uniref:Uncharacterized protein n=1 Tax=Staphylotrichum tortipilum TaxID=2831512 RepID=A0AAN6RUD2_9PEZI|nr:hypothetical protein C8A05DRAFT_33406 [Staphylotrichum longicolle]